MVVGFVFDKSLKPVLALLPKNAIYYFCKAAIPRGLSAKDLKKMAEYYDLEGKVYESVQKALDAAKSNAKSKDLIFLGGSIYVVGEII